MSLSINSNLSAGIALNNLSDASQSLQKSLNRLSSGSKIGAPSDDAGGMAVAMSFNNSIRRQAQVSNGISNAKSYLQAQDGALETAHKLLDRMSELKTLNADVTKSASDKSNYNTEFKELQAQLSSLENETFNGLALFGSETLSVNTDANGSAVASIEIGGVELMGSGSVLLEDSFGGSSLSSDWIIDNGSPTVGGGVLNLEFDEVVKTASTFDEDVLVEFDVKIEAGEVLNFGNNDTSYFSGFQYDIDVGDDDWHTISFRMNTDGTMSDLKLDGTLTPSPTLQSTPAGPIEFVITENSGGVGNGIDVRDLSITTVSGGGSVGSVSDVTDLDSVSINEVKSAIEEIATSRAKIGAQQSRLDFAAEQITVNKSNLEAARSRIIDVDVAEESTQLARYNILMQAGASMLQQANQTPQLALRLLA